jgi:hypothetical protein
VPARRPSDHLPRLDVGSVGAGSPVRGIGLAGGSPASDPGAGFSPRSGRELARLHPVRHDLAHGCGERMPCPLHGLLEGGYHPAERLRNGDVIAHDCGIRWRPTELPGAAA